ncbi:MAG: RluA family pseudouridine synthase, partial [Parvularculaceae bacterium]
MGSVQTLTVGADESGMRLDRWFRARFPSIKHGELEKLLRTGQVRVDGGRAKSNRRLEEGEKIRIPPTGAKKVERPRAAPSRKDEKFLRDIIVYEDDAIIALNKPFGLAVQGGAKTERHLDGMLDALAKNGERPRLVHRLDRDTGGLLILARTRAAAAILGHAFQRRGVDKTYWALVAGSPRPRFGAIDLPVAKKMTRVGGASQERMVPADDDDAKKAITDFQI